MTRSSWFFVLAVLSVFLLATTVTTQAKDQLQFPRVQTEQSVHNNTLRQSGFLSPSKGLSLRIPVVNLSKRDLAKLKWALTRSAHAVIPQDDLSAGCFGDCLRGSGISPAQLAGCGAVCSVNLVGCAICAGVSEWIILACGQICVWRGLISEQDAVSNRHPRHSTKRPLPRLVASNLQYAA